MTPRNGFLFGIGVTTWWVPIAAYKVVTSETARHFLFSKQPRLGQRERRNHGRINTLPVLAHEGPRDREVHADRPRTTGPVLSQAR